MEAQLKALRSNDATDNDAITPLTGTDVALTSGRTKRGLDTTPIGAFDIDAAAKFFTVELTNANLTVIYKFRTGSIAGPVVNTITLNYATAQTLILTDGALT